MAVPSSGQLRLRADINQEINGNDTDTNVSLGTLSNDAGFTEPDNMSEFYGYSSCGTPAFRTTYSSANPNGNIMLYTVLDYLPACNTVEYGLYVGTNSSGPTANTKYQVGTSWGVYQWSYPTVGGFTNGQTYYAWIYNTNSAGKTGYSSMQTVTVPAAYIPVTHSSMNPTGDMANLWCPNNNFNGGFRPIFTNSTSNTSMDVYGDGNFTHTDPSYPNCKQTFGVYSPQSASRQPSCVLRSSTCRVFAGQSSAQACGNTINGYVKYYYSGYSDRIYNQSVNCQAC